MSVGRFARSGGDLDGVDEQRVDGAWRYKSREQRGYEMYVELLREQNREFVAKA